MIKLIKYFLTMLPIVVLVFSAQLRAEDAKPIELLLDHDQWDEVDLTFPNSIPEAMVDPTNPRWTSLADEDKKSEIRRISESVGRLKVWTPDGIRKCTAFLVSENLAMTNNHCIPGKNGDAIRAKIEMGYYRLLSPIRAFKVNPIPIAREIGADFAIVHVEGSPGKKYGFLQMAETFVQSGSDLKIIHHPGGKPKKISQEDCFAGKTKGLKYDHFRHSCDTIGGSSGSPILNEENLVVGIHHSGVPSLQIAAINLGTLAPRLKVKLAAVSAIEENTNIQVDPSQAFPTGFLASIQAQAICVALGGDTVNRANPNAASLSGWISAVPRQCDPLTVSCDQICANMGQSAKDGQRKNASTNLCIDSLHIYDDEPSTESGVPGLKTYRYRSCTTGGCGPNYCCCGSF